MVAEVAPHLAADRRPRIAEEVRGTRGVVPAGGLHQAEARDLLEVLDRHAARAIAPGDVDRDLQVHLDDLVLQDAPLLVIVGGREAREQTFGGLAPRQLREVAGARRVGWMSG